MIDYDNISIILPSLIQKISPYLENLVLHHIQDSNIRGNLFDSISVFCQKIKFLHLERISYMNISQLSKVIINLKYLTLEGIHSKVLKGLSKLPPLSLHYLDLSFEEQIH